jgi:hypothetical protein
MIAKSLASHETVEALADAILADDPPGISYMVHIYYDETATLGAPLLEARYSGVPLGGKYSARRDPAHSSAGDVHLHIFARNNEIAAINRDGSAHDGSSGFPLPSRAADGIRRHYPDFHVPADNIIESVPPALQALLNASIEHLLLEEGGT